MNDFNFSGLYHGQIFEQALQPASTGTPQIVLKCRILAKEAKDGSISQVPDAVERTIWMSLTEKTKGWVAEDLASAGFHGKPSQISPESPNFIDLRGNEVRLWCKQEAGTDGQMRERWSISRPRKAVAPLDISRAAELDAMFGDAFDAGSAGSSSAPAPTAGTRIGPDLG